MSIQHLPLNLRPREKILALSAEMLTDAELLAIILRTGIKGTDVLTLANDILRQQRGLAGLLSCSATQLKSIKGLGGKAKRAEILAIIEITKRALQQNLQRQPIFTTSNMVKDFCHLQLANQQQEIFAALFLDNQHQLIKFEKLFWGTVNKTNVQPREILRKALLYNSSALIFTHNHPSGSARPSAEDTSLTNYMRDKLKEFDIQLLDHIIVAANKTISMAELNLI